MAELTFEQQAALYKEANRDLLSQLGIKPGSSAGGGGGAAPASAVSANWAVNAINGANQVQGAFIQLSKGTLQLKDVFDASGKMLGILGPVGGAIGKWGADTATAAIEVNTSLRDVSKNGAYFGNNLGLYNNAVLGAKMTLPEFTNTLTTSGTRIAGLASNVDKSSLVFLKLGKDIQEDPLVYKLQAMGMGVEETNKILVTTASNRRNMDMSSEKAARATIDATIQLAVEMDNTARLTGKSREEQRKLLDDQMKRTDVRLAMQLMTPEQKAAFEKASVVAGRLGEKGTQAARIYATGGPKNAEDTAIITQLGPTMSGLVKQLVTETDEGKRKDIQRQIDLEAMRVANDKEQIAVAQNLASSTDANAKGIALATADQVEYGNIMLQLDREAKAKNMDCEKYREENFKRVAQERAVAGTGAADKTALVSQTINQSDRALKDMASGTGIAFNKLNTEAGILTQEFIRTNGALRVFKPVEVADAPGKILKKAEKEAGVTKVTVPESERPIKRQDGSLGAVGKLIEDFGAGTPAMLHGKEGIITEKQLNGLMGGVTGGLKTQLETAKSGMPTIDSFEKMFSQMKMPDMGEMTKSIAGSMPTAPSGSGSDSISDVAKGIDQLNMRIERLITAVTDGSDKNVRALKSGKNMLGS